MSEDKVSGLALVLVMIAIIIVLLLVNKVSNPCTRPFPNAQTIIDCQKLQPTNTP